MVRWGVHILKSLYLKPQKVIAGAFYQFIAPLPSNPLQNNSLQGIFVLTNRLGMHYFHCYPLSKGIYLGVSSHCKFFSGT